MITTQAEFKKSLDTGSWGAVHSVTGFAKQVAGSNCTEWPQPSAYQYPVKRGIGKLTGVAPQQEITRKMRLQALRSHFRFVGDTALGPGNSLRMRILFPEFLSETPPLPGGQHEVWPNHLPGRCGLNKHHRSVG
jgi:hypothetical protein